MYEAEFAFLGDKMQEATRQAYLAGVEAGKAGASGWYFAIGVLVGVVVSFTMFGLYRWQGK
jgi:hypothetical protein